MSKRNFSLAHASALANAGKFPEALAVCRKICQTNKGNPDVWMMLGALHGQMNNANESVICLNQAIRLRPDFAEAHYNLGYILWMQGKSEEALTSLQQSTNLRPGYLEAWIIMGSIHGVLGRLDQAEFCCRQALQLQPDCLDAHMNLANALLFSGRLDDAAMHYHKALSLARTPPQESASCCGLGTALQFMGKPDDALVYCERALKIDPQNIDAIALAANIADRKGNPEKAYQLLSPLMEQATSNINATLAFSGICKTLKRQDEGIRLMERLLEAQSPLSATGRRHLHFQSGMLYDSIGEYDKAFEHYRRGNELKPLRFHPEHHRVETQTLISAYNPAFMDTAPRANLQSDRPVFIVGMVRSGTSLVEQILSSHSAICGAGELPGMTHMIMTMQRNLVGDTPYPHSVNLLTQTALDDFARDYLDGLPGFTAGFKRVVDKAPLNFLYLGLIELVFPNARIIHCMRNPLDTCLSAYFQDFTQNHPYCYDLYNVGAFYKQYEKLMQHWREVLKIPMLEIQYEELIANQEEITRNMLGFCGVDWEDGCLEFHKTKRYVATASYDQVRHKLYTKSAGRWKNYERHLGPLHKALQEN